MTITKLTNTIAALQSRRQFLRASVGLGLSAAGMALLGACGSPATSPTATKEILETATIRVARPPSVICLAPEYLAEDILKSEGFTNVQYIEDGLGPVRTVASGQADLGLTLSASLIVEV